MIIGIIVFLFLFRSSCVEYLHTSVEIENCDGGESFTSISKHTDKIKCAMSTDMFKLGKKGEVVIHSVTYKNEQAATKANLCKKVDTDYDVKKGSDFKNMIYTDSSEHRAILSGADANTCFSALVVPKNDLMSGYLHVKTISCISDDMAPNLQKSDAIGKDSKFYHVTGKICFLAPMVIEKFETDLTIDNKPYKLTVSAYPKKECPSCEPVTSQKKEAPTK